jgi:hypothetical protein
MDCEYLKALTDLFAMAESEEKITSATQNNGSCYNIKQIDATVKTPEINSINQYTPSKSGTAELN